MKMRKFVKMLCTAFLVPVFLLIVWAGEALAEPKAYELILPEADTRVYTEADLDQMTPQVACYARNEIYALHGRKFRSAELSAWFEEQPWYSGTIEPDDFSDDMLNSVEMANIDLLLKVERAKTPDGTGYKLNQEGYSFDEVLDYIYTDFDILEGLQVYNTAANVFMDSEHFFMMVPNNLNWAYEQTDHNSFEIYYKPARDTGFGGHVVSIRAYDLEDEEYQVFPDWQLCGETKEKRYIAILPTDVQFNPNDSTQTEEYNKLLEWAYTLDVTAKETANPFRVVEEEPAETGAVPIGPE